MGHLGVELEDGSSTEVLAHHIISSPLPWALLPRECHRRATSVERWGGQLHQPKDVSLSQDCYMQPPCLHPQENIEVNLEAQECRISQNLEGLITEKTTSAEASLMVQLLDPRGCPLFAGKPHVLFSYLLSESGVGTLRQGHSGKWGIL